MTPTFPERFNLAVHLLDDRVAEGRGDRIAIVTPTEEVTYAELAARANRVANLLREAGVGKGDRVLWALPDDVPFAALFFGTLKLGAVGAMANPDLPPDDHAYLLGYTGAKVFVTTPEIAARMDPATKTEASRFVAGGETAGWLSLDHACARSSPQFVNEDTHRDDVALWLFTSGSTGKPKAALHRHQDFAYHIECYAKGVLGLGESDVTLAVPRLYFPYATGMNLMFPLAVGGKAVLVPERPTPESLFAAIETHSPTVMSTVPTMTAKMLAHPRAIERDVSSLRLVVSAGEALPPELAARWTSTFGIDMLDGIGSAEMFHIYISNRPREARAGSLGRLVPGYQARVVGPDGTDAAPGDPGTLWVTGGSVFLGYHGDNEATRAVLNVDPKTGTRWVVSGDTFTKDADGFFRYQGRTDDMLKVGGIYVSPLEVENVLRAHPAVADCAVVGHADEHGLVKPRAFIVPRAGWIAGESLFDDLRTFARERLARYKVPRWWEARTELPRNDRGKTLRRLLRDDHPG